MIVIFRKLIIDFRRGPLKVALMVIAAALSSWGISSVIYAYFMSERDFQVNFGTTYPADMVFTVDNFSEDHQALVLAEPQVIDMEYRDALSARIRNRQGSWMPLIIYGIDDAEQMRYDRFEIPDPSLSAPGQLLIERNAFFFLDEEWDAVEILFTGEQDPVNWVVAGKVHDPRMAPARMEGVVYAYTTSQDVLTPFLPANRKRMLIETRVSESMEELEALASQLRSQLQTAGASVVSVSIPEPGEHIHQGVIDGVSFLQRTGGSILSIMGVILLSLILLTWVFPQTVDIGVMKALGASNREILAAYSVALCLLIGLGIAIGLPLGYQSAGLYNGMVAFFQNFEVVPDLLPLPIHLLVVLVALAVPFVFGSLPIRRVAATTVQEAMNKTFYTPRGRPLLGSIGMLKPSSRYNINNLLRHTPRTALTMLLMAVGVGLFFTSTNTDQSVRKDLEMFANESKYQMNLRMPTDASVEEIAFLQDLEHIDEVLPTRIERVTFTPPTGGNPESAFVRTVVPQVRLNQGDMVLGELDRGCSNCLYVANEEMSHLLENVPLHTNLSLANGAGEVRSYRYSGVVRTQAGIEAPFLALDAAVEESFNAVTISLAKGLTAEENFKVSNAVDDAFLMAGIDLTARTTIGERVQAILSHLDPTFVIIKVTGLVTMILGFLGIIIVLNLTLQERTRELGIIKSLGGSVSTISSLLNREFLLISIVSAIVGSLVAAPLGMALTDLLADTLIRHPVAYGTDWRMTATTLGVLLLSQALFITIYNRVALKKNARELLDHQF